VGRTRVHVLVGDLEVAVTVDEVLYTATRSEWIASAGQPYHGAERRGDARPATAPVTLQIVLSVPAPG
jgi:hypothetical protein